MLSTVNKPKKYGKYGKYAHTNLSYMTNVATLKNKYLTTYLVFIIQSNINRQKGSVKINSCNM